ncbi:DNA binding protein, putative isoform 2 [Hibiscus syriacus]|uniref:DNA binding protein, putative isoform 2 n=1 Tax=Hibiscus syriacus TaxID=106335 RepID=A0A6A2ZR46_HIBSY|nr:uncharacterized protein LOC120140149 [Hibiscus syriacus]KAE8694501.1 DNA binding protein, putative isoform 2 [Hibiscus syriacus]
MDQDGPPSGQRKVRFTPKAPKSSRKPKLVVAKTEDTDEDGGAAQAQYLLGRFKENLTRQGPKVEKKASVQVAFGPGAPSSTSLRTYGTQRDETPYKGTDVIRRRSLPSISEKKSTDICSSAATTEAPAPKIKGGYREPWDYRTYYPITLPLRRPYSGDPELLDKAEFGESAGKEYDEETINPAKDLGLLEEAEKEKMFFFQLPVNLPLPKQSASRKGKEEAEKSVSSERAVGLTKGQRFEELPAGHVGKMLVFKSGAVKLKLGETLFDVSPGMSGVFAQNVAVINTTDKQCCIIGELGQKAVVTPDSSIF